MSFSGPAAGTGYLMTKFSTDGSKTRGTLNNCANGSTPWGTYLTCEENWAGYFRRIAATDNPNRSAKELASFTPLRRGRHRPRAVGHASRPTRPTTSTAAGTPRSLGAADARDDYRNGANTYGWVVEIDPFTPGQHAEEAHRARPLRPRRRLRSARWWPASRWSGTWATIRATSTSTSSSRRRTGTRPTPTAAWPPATSTWTTASSTSPSSTPTAPARGWSSSSASTASPASNAAYAFADAADVLVNARLAADAAGATKMDRPEWTRRQSEDRRGLRDADQQQRRLAPARRHRRRQPALLQRPEGRRATAQTGNPNGHIVRFADDGGDPAATDASSGTSTCSAPAPAPTGRRQPLGPGRRQRLLQPRRPVVQPGHRRPAVDARPTTAPTPTSPTACCWPPCRARSATARPRPSPTSTARPRGSRPPSSARRRARTACAASWSGPKDCEITGIAESGDGRALFVNIQHPGETTPAANIGNPALFGSHWPDGGTCPPALGHRRDHQERRRARRPVRQALQDGAAGNGSAVL